MRKMRKEKPQLDQIISKKSEKNIKRIFVLGDIYVVANTSGISYIRKENSQVSQS